MGIFEDFTFELMIRQTSQIWSKNGILGVLTLVALSFNADFA